MKVSLFFFKFFFFLSLRKLFYKSNFYFGLASSLGNWYNFILPPWYSRHHSDGHVAINSEGETDDCLTEETDSDYEGMFFESFFMLLKFYFICGIKD